MDYDMGTKVAALCADPPWKFGDKLPGKSRGAEKNYTVMTTEEIMRLPLPPLADDGLLFLWRVSSMVEDAYRVMRAWGFEPKTEIVWRKRRTRDVHRGQARTADDRRSLRGAVRAPSPQRLGDVREPGSRGGIVKALAALLLLALACGGAMTEPPSETTACELPSGERYDCAPLVFVFEDRDAESVASGCEIAGCSRGARCAVFLGNETKYGMCR